MLLTTQVRSDLINEIRAISYQLDLFKQRYFILKVTLNCLYVTRTFSQVNSKSMLKGNQNDLSHLQIKMAPLNTNGRDWVSSSIPGQHPVWYHCKKRVSVHKKVSLIVFSRLTAPQRPPTYCTIWGLSGSWRLLISWRNAFSPCLQRHLPPFALCLLCLRFPPPLTCTERAHSVWCSAIKKKIIIPNWRKRSKHDIVYE